MVGFYNPQHINYGGEEEPGDRAEASISVPARIESRQDGGGS